MPDGEPTIVASARVSPVVAGLAIVLAIPAVVMAALYAHPNPRPSPGAWAAVLAVALGLFALTARMLLIRAEATPQGIEVRAVFRTTAVAWSEVRSAAVETTPMWVSLVSFGFAGGDCVRIERFDGSVLRPLSLYRNACDQKPADFVCAVNTHLEAHRKKPVGGAAG